MLTVLTQNLANSDRPSNDVSKHAGLSGLRPRPLILGALLEAASHGLRTLSGVCLKRLPRMADFALWATACETALWPAGTFMRAYEENRRAAIEGVIEADPVADHVRDMMAKAITWTGRASDLHRIGADRSPDGCSARSSGWPKSPRALAGRLRRAQTSLRALGIEITFSREGRGGTRIIRMVSRENPSGATVSTVSTVRDDAPFEPEQAPLRPSHLHRAHKEC